MPADKSNIIFSIVTVVLNDNVGFTQTLLSLHKQEFRQFEWIVVDGGSTDGTKNLIVSSEGRASKWVSEKDSGIYDAMNKGVKLSEGRYIVFMNAGDIFTDAFVLEKVNDHLLGCANFPDVLFGGANLVLPNNTARYRQPYLMDKYIWHGLPANHQATYFKSECIKRIPFDVKYRVCGDYYLAANLFMQKAKATYLDIPLVDFRVGGTSYRNLKNLFFEPYSIQKTVLKLSMPIRCASLIKRFISTAGLKILSQL